MVLYLAVKAVMVAEQYFLWGPVDRKDGQTKK